MKTRVFLHLGDSATMTYAWVAVDEIVALRSSTAGLYGPGGTVVTLRSGQEYESEFSPEDLLERMDAVRRIAAARPKPRPVRPS